MDMKCISIVVTPLTLNPWVTSLDAGRLILTPSATAFLKALMYTPRCGNFRQSTIEWQVKHSRSSEFRYKFAGPQLAGLTITRENDCGARFPHDAFPVWHIPTTPTNLVFQYHLYEIRHRPSVGRSICYPKEPA